jgi:hypothetical protein
MDQVDLQVAPWEMTCSPGWLYMSPTAQGIAIYREQRELERQATEMRPFEPVLRAAAARVPVLGCQRRSLFTILRLGRTATGQQ